MLKTIYFWNKTLFNKLVEERFSEISEFNEKNNFDDLTW